MRGHDKMMMKKWLSILVIILATLMTAKFALAAAPSLEVSEVLFEDAQRNVPITETITLTNNGDVPLTVVTATHNINVGFSPSASPLTVTPSTIPVGGTATVTLQITIPEEEDSGLSTIGTLTVNTAEGVIKTADVKINTESGLVINSIKINGKSSGDLSVEDVNEIEVEVENQYDEDMKDVVITVEILDVDGDDLEEYSDEFDMDSNGGNDDQREETVEFDLTDEQVDEDEYEVVVTVEGEDDNGARHTTEEVKTVNVDRDKHKIVITDAALSPSSLSCGLQLEQASLEVRIKNVGESDEDDVEIVVKNSEMGLDSRRSNIELDDFSGNDNDYRATFQIEVDKEVKAGTKKLDIQVYRDGNLEDTEEITLTIPSCGDQATGGSTTDIDKLIEQAKKELQESLDAQKEEMVVTSKVPLRESSTYLALLSVLTVLLLIAVLLGLVILLVRRSPNKK